LDPAVVFHPIVDFFFPLQRTGLFTSISLNNDENNEYKMVKKKGVDIEHAAYRGIPADPRDDEAPVLGNTPPATSS
jgi:hypothetical protein